MTYLESQKKIWKTCTKNGGKEKLKNFDGKVVFLYFYSILFIFTFLFTVFIFLISFRLFYFHILVFCCEYPR